MTMKNRTKKGLIALGALSLGMGGICFADTAQENADLALVVRQLQAVYPLIYAAQKQVDPDSRQQFHYDWLRQDLGTIIAGINQKLSPQPIEPRQIQPIKGDYLTTESNDL